MVPDRAGAVGLRRLTMRQVMRLASTSAAPKLLSAMTSPDLVRPYHWWVGNGSSGHAQISSRHNERPERSTCGRSASGRPRLTSQLARGGEEVRRRQSVSAYRGSWEHAPRVSRAHRGSLKACTNDEMSRSGADRRVEFCCRASAGAITVGENAK